MASIDYGSDFSCSSDLDFDLSLTSKRRSLGESVARRLGTSAGYLFYDPNFGYNVTDLIGRAGVVPQVVAANVQNELVKDERINDAVATVTLNADRLTILCEVQDDDGPFDMTFTVEQRTGGQQIVLEFDESI